MKRKYKVLVIDDSLFMRSMLAEILSADPELEVVGTAHDGKAGLERLHSLQPDVVTLDVEMPIMDGVECLKRIMRERPTPAVMVSSITYEGGFKTMQALSAGAFDYVQKPMAQSASALQSRADDIREKVKTAVTSGYLARHPACGASAATVQKGGSTLLAHPSKANAPKDFDIIAIGISTGGPPCIQKILEILPATSPPVVIVQHMPAGFTKAMAKRIDDVSQLDVTEAVQGVVLKPGMALIAPGDYHLSVVSQGGTKRAVVSHTELVSGHRPSADVLFHSLVPFGKRVLGVIMTGMGRDGVNGLKAIRKAGGYTIGQDEASCVVYGMPKVARQEDALDEVLSLDGIALRLKEVASRGRSSAPSTKAA